MTIAPGTELLGKYRIQEFVSRTPYLELYSAEHLILGRAVHVALLREEVAARPGVAARLLDLGRALANDRAPELLDIYESIEIPGKVGVVTEVPPELASLADAMNASSEVWSADAIRDYMVPCVRALQQLHERGQVHGAIAPRSFVRTPEGGARLIDLVHIRLEAPRLTALRPPPLDDVRYLAPEWFADASEVTSAADVYSIGCILYELATGQAPFLLDDPRALMSAHLAERPAEPRTIRPSVPDGMERIILRALSKHPLYRFESTGAFADALQSYQRYLAPIPVGSAPWERDATARADEEEPLKIPEAEAADGGASQGVDDTRQTIPESVEGDDADETHSDEADTVTEAISAVNAVAGASPVAEIAAETVTEEISVTSSEPSAEPPHADNDGLVTGEEDVTAADDETTPSLSAEEPTDEPEEVSGALGARARSRTSSAEDTSPEVVREGPPGADGTVLRVPWQEKVVVIRPTAKRDSAPESEPSAADKEAQDNAEGTTAEDREEQSREPGRERLVGYPSPVAARRRFWRWVIAGMVLLMLVAGGVAGWFFRPALGSDARVTVDRRNEEIETLLLFEPGPDMVVVPAGPVMMGGRPHPQWWEGNQLPMRAVPVQAFAIDETEVSAGEYRRCVEAGPCSEPGYPDRPLELEPDEPVAGISWHDAAAYCAFVDKRLPTELEWEAAARGRSNRFFPWGDHYQCHRANVTAEQCRTPQPGGPEPVDGGQVGASPLGVQRMAGNVWEWTADDYVEPEWLDAPGQPEAPEDRGRGKVIKGGDWASPPRAIGWRIWNPPDIRDPHGGFRCARTLTDPGGSDVDNPFGGRGSPNHQLSGLMMGGEFQPLARPLTTGGGASEP